MHDYDDEPLQLIYDLLSEQQMKFYELVELMGEYRRMVEDAAETSTEHAVRVARGLPGAKYHVGTEWIRQNWFKYNNEINRVFGPAE
jgi:hypothetical protein